MRQSVIFIWAVSLLAGCGGGGSSAETSSVALTGSSATIIQSGTPATTLVSGSVQTSSATAIRPWVIGHRGFPGWAPENTLSGYRVAIWKQADYVETDVAQTLDGQLVLMHDSNLIRTTNVQKIFPGRPSYEVSAFTLAEIKQLDAGSWFSNVYANEPVPTLAELLTLLQENKTGLFLELKSGETDLAEKVAHQLIASGWVQNGVAREKITVISFSSDHLKKLQILLPLIPISLLVSADLSEEQIAGIATYATGVDIDFRLINTSLLALLAKYKLSPAVWTVDNPSDIDAMLALPIAGITTDNLPYLRSKLPLK